MPKVNEINKKKKAIQSDFEFYQESFVTVLWQVDDVRDLRVKIYRRQNTVIDE